MSTLTFFRRTQQLFEYKISNTRTQIGRSDNCDIALPGETLSRIHCFIDQRTKGWFLVDRSRHGTWVKDNRISRMELSNRCEFSIGEYRVVFKEAPDPVSETTQQIISEEYAFVACADEEILVTRAVLCVDNGPKAGQKYPLNNSRVSLGGTGSEIVLMDPGLVPRHCVLRVSRGRVMIEPAMGPVYVDGQRVLDITPIYKEEQFRIGDTRLRIESVDTKEADSADSFGAMIGESHCIKGVFGRLKRFAAHDFPVLITGESGTGKELAARGIHTHSKRGGGPFVAINCGAIPENLFESELFGHIKGAFTGAEISRKGAFQQADGGTLFLDELAELPESMQVKLLRVLESGEIRRVGAQNSEYPDVRIVAATNADLSNRVDKKKFRADLFFRLSVLSAPLPALRDRPEDIPILARLLLSKLSPNAVIHEAALEMLINYEWPGNIRELRNVLSRAFVLGGDQITKQNIQFYGLGIQHSARYSKSIVSLGEFDYLKESFDRHNGNKAAMAREMGIARTTLLYRLKRAGL